jgi:hypothetical protein
LPGLKTNWEVGDVFESDLAFHEDFLAQVEDLRKASLVFVEGILGMRGTSSSILQFLLA